MTKTYDNGTDDICSEFFKLYPNGQLHNVAEFINGKNEPGSDTKPQLVDLVNRFDKLLLSFSTCPGSWTANLHLASVLNEAAQFKEAIRTISAMVGDPRYMRPKNIPEMESNPESIDQIFRSLLPLK